MIYISEVAISCQCHYVNQTRVFGYFCAQSLLIITQLMFECNIQAVCISVIHIISHNDNIIAIACM